MQKDIHYPVVGVLSHTSIFSCPLLCVLELSRLQDDVAESDSERM